MPIEGFKRKFCSRSYLPKNDLTFFFFSRICCETLVGAVLLSKNKKTLSFHNFQLAGFCIKTRVALSKFYFPWIRIKLIITKRI